MVDLAQLQKRGTLLLSVLSSMFHFSSSFVQFAAYPVLLIIILLLVFC